MTLDLDSFLVWMIAENKYSHNSPEINCCSSLRYKHRNVLILLFVIDC